MPLKISEDELEEIKPFKDSEDKAIIINPLERGRKENGENRPDEVREIIANDAIELGSSALAAKIHGVDKTSVQNYAKGEIVSPEARNRILDKKHGIADLALTKLMDSLNLIDPGEAESVKDQMVILNGLANLVDKVTDNKESKEKPQVHLHLWSPNQKSEKDYPIIEA